MLCLNGHDEYTGSPTLGYPKGFHNDNVSQTPCSVGRVVSNRFSPLNTNNNILHRRGFQLPPNQPPRAYQPPPSFHNNRHHHRREPPNQQPPNGSYNSRQQPSSSNHTPVVPETVSFFNLHNNNNLSSNNNIRNNNISNNNNNQVHSSFFSENPSSSKTNDGELSFCFSSQTGHPPSNYPPRRFLSSSFLNPPRQHSFGQSESFFKQNNNDFRYFQTRDDRRSLYHRGNNIHYEDKKSDSCPICLFDFCRCQMRRNSNGNSNLGNQSLSNGLRTSSTSSSLSYYNHQVHPSSFYNNNNYVMPMNQHSIRSSFSMPNMMSNNNFFSSHQFFPAALLRQGGEFVPPPALLENNYGCFSMRNKQVVEENVQKHDNTNNIINDATTSAINSSKNDFLISKNDANKIHLSKPDSSFYSQVHLDSGTQKIVDTVQLSDGLEKFDDCPPNDKSLLVNEDDFEKQEFLEKETVCSVNVMTESSKENQGLNSFEFEENGIFSDVFMGNRVNPCDLEGLTSCPSPLLNLYHQHSIRSSDHDDELNAAAEWNSLAMSASKLSTKSLEASLDNLWSPRPSSKKKIGEENKNKERKLQSILVSDRKRKSQVGNSTDVEGQEEKPGLGQVLPKKKVKFLMRDNCIVEDILTFEKPSPQKNKSESKGKLKRLMRDMLCRPSTNASMLTTISSSSV